MSKIIIQISFGKIFLHKFVYSVIDNYSFNASIYIFRINYHKMDVRKPLKSNKSKQSCCVPDWKMVTFHVFRNMPNCYLIWNVKIGRDIGPLIQITSHTKICSRHFIDSDFRIYTHNIFS